MRFRFWRTSIILSSLLMFWSTLTYAQADVIRKGNTYYLAGTVAIKYCDQLTSDVNGRVELPPAFSKSLSKFGIREAYKKFRLKDQNSRRGKELSKILTLKFESPYDPVFLSEKLSRLPGIEWAEPHFVYELQFTPNDPDYASQWNLSKISASQAWDISTGDSDIVIAIVDTGVDWDHPDLSSNIWQNDDPLGLGDDDANGYVDDLRGWDFGGLDGTPDNNPMEDKPDHGTLVAGIAGAVTNNGVGVASISFNCTIMPVKVIRNDRRFDNGSPMVIFGFEGIVYAADNGAKVINTSWGGSGYSIAGQEVVSYALSKGALVVAAGGNDGTDEIIYPARYNGVLSVGASQSTDARWSATNYGADLDVMAPGASIYSTWQDDTYATANGTSMAAPITAGLAGLIFEHFPNYTPEQVAEQIRTNCDNIDNLNPGYERLLGKGRINAYSALNNGNSKAVRAVGVKFEDQGDGDGILENGETVSIEAEFMNYLNPTSNLSITLESTSNYAAPINSSFNPGAIGSLTQFNNGTNKYSFVIDQNSPLNTKVYFVLNYSDVAYQDFQWFSVIINPSFSTQRGNDVALTITSKGIFGFDDIEDPNSGDGFIYQDGPNLLFIGNFMYGISEQQVVSATSIGQVEVEGFTTITPFTISTPGETADQQGFTSFNDDATGTGKLGITTSLFSYSFSDEPFEKFIILRFALLNTTGNTINNLYAGLFLDWDMDAADYNDNIAAYDTDDNFGYAYNSNLDPVDTYVGMAIVSSQEFGFYAIMNDGSMGDIQVYDGFSMQEKWKSLSSGIGIDSTGPGDISYG